MPRVTLIAHTQLDERPCAVSAFRSRQEDCHHQDRGFLAHLATYRNCDCPNLPIRRLPAPEEAHNAGVRIRLNHWLQSPPATHGFEVVANKNGYSKLCDQVNAIDEKARRLAERILEIEPTDRMGDSIHAGAALVLDEPECLEYNGGDVLRRMAARAGFSVAV